MPAWIEWVRACLHRSFLTNTPIQQPPTHTHLSTSTRGDIWSSNKNRGCVYHCMSILCMCVQPCMCYELWVLLSLSEGQTTKCSWKVISKALGWTAKTSFFQQIDEVWVKVRKQSLTLRTAHVSSPMFMPFLHTISTAQPRGVLSCHHLPS